MAEITPSGFRLARVPPLLGRRLLDGDAAPGAAAVIVIGFDVWRSRFASAPDVVGRTLRLGRHGPHSRRRHARRVRVSREPSLLDSAEGGSVGIQAGRGSIDLHRRTPRARVRPGRRERRTHRHRSPHGRRVPGHSPASAPGGLALHLSVRRHEQKQFGRLLAHGRPRQPAPGRRLRQRRHPHLRADGDPAGRDCGSFGSRGQSRADRRTALRRVPRPVRRGSGRGTRGREDRARLGARPVWRSSNSRTSGRTTPCRGLPSSTSPRSRCSPR